MSKIQINNEVRDMTSEEENKLSEDKTRYANDKQEYISSETAKATAQASGNQKLLDLGLTQAEATALTGYTPPVAE